MSLQNDKKEIMLSIRSSGDETYEYLEAFTNLICDGLVSIEDRKPILTNAGESALDLVEGD